jgi:putative methylase
MLLWQVKPHPSPKPSLEQYTIPSDVAAAMLYMAAYTYNDIIGKTILDLGCGTGRLALGAAFLGAKQVVGVDVDKTAVKIALENSEKTGLKDKVLWVAADIDAIHGKFDTVLQNPPFGVQRRKADRKFLEKALKVGDNIYSLHKSLCKDKAVIRKLKAKKPDFLPGSPSPFLKGFIKKHSGEVEAVYTTLMTVPHMFSFHTKQQHTFMVDLYVIRKVKRHGEKNTSMS